MLAFLFASVGFRIVRRTWLYTVLAVASYQLGARAAERPLGTSARAATGQARRAPSRGYINAPGFHFDD